MSRSMYFKEKWFKFERLWLPDMKDYVDFCELPITENPNRASTMMPILVSTKSKFWIRFKYTPQEQKAYSSMDYNHAHNAWLPIDHQCFIVKPTRNKVLSAIFADFTLSDIKIYFFRRYEVIE